MDTKEMTISPDELLAPDLTLVSKPANLFRFRIDDDQVVIDFGYLPPVRDDELAGLAEHAASVHSRIAIPFALAKDVIEQLLQNIQEAEKLRDK